MNVEEESTHKLWQVKQQPQGRVRRNETRESPRKEGDERRGHFGSLRVGSGSKVCWRADKGKMLRKVGEHAEG